MRAPRSTIEPLPSVVGPTISTSGPIRTPSPSTIGPYSRADGSTRQPAPASTPGAISLPSDFEPHLAFERVVVRLLVLFEVADVGPVRVDHVAAELHAVAQHLGEEVAREIVVAAPDHPVEDGRFEHVDAGVDRVGEDLAPRRLLEEARDAAGLVGDDDAEFERVGDALQRDRDVVVLALVVFDQRGEVDVGQRVARDDEERIAGQQLVGHLHRAGRAERGVLDDVFHRHAELGAVVEVRFDLVGQVVQRGDDLGDAVASQKSDDVFHHRLAGNRRERLRTARGQRPQPRPLAAGHQYAFHTTSPTSGCTLNLYSNLQARGRISRSRRANRSNRPSVAIVSRSSRSLRRQFGYSR